MAILDAIYGLSSYNAGSIITINSQQVTVADIIRDGGFISDIDIVGKTKYFANTTGTIGVRGYADDDTYTGTFTLVDGVYEITGNTLTIDRINPSASTSVLTYLGENAGVMSFNISIDGGTDSKAYFYDTAEERDAAINKVNPALIMYLLN